MVLRGHLAKFGGYNWDGGCGATGLPWVGVKGASEHPSMHSKASTAELS